MDQAEQLRNIIKAENVQRPMARVLTVTSGKGGVGKSNTAINLAIQFRRLGQRVIILDADFGLANIEIMFGTVPKHNLCDLIYQGKNIREIITWGPMDVGFVSGGSGIVGMSNLSRDYLSYIFFKCSSLAPAFMRSASAMVSAAIASTTTTARGTMMGSCRPLMDTSMFSPCLLTVSCGEKIDGVGFT